MCAFPVPHMALWLAVFFVVSGPICVAQKDGAADLPLRKVVLFTSGVGFFDHRGEVDGDARVELEFDVKDANDLLKSMVVQDFGGGRVSAVTYGSRDPVTRTLATFAIELT